MQDWVRNRELAYQESFWDALERLGISVLAFDELSWRFEESLSNSSDAELKAKYLRPDGQHLVLTPPHKTLPRLLVAFVIDSDDKGKIVFVSVRQRP